MWEEMIAAVLQSPHPVLIRLVPQADPAGLPKPGSHRSAGTVQALSFPPLHFLPGRKVPEGEPWEPKLTGEVSGRGFGKYQRPLMGAHQELQAGGLSPAASRARQQARNPRACVHP